MRYNKFQYVLRLLYLEFKEVEHEMKQAKLECPGESLDCYLVQLILLNELIEALNGNPMFITTDENFTSSRLDNKYARKLDKLSPHKFPFVVK